MNHLELSRQYLDLLNTVEEGLEYVLASFLDYEKTEGELIISDILKAFNQILESNKILLSIYKEESSIVQLINDFETVILEATNLNMCYIIQMKKEKFCVNTLLLHLSTGKQSLTMSYSHL